MLGRLGLMFGLSMCLLFSVVQCGAEDTQLERTSEKPGEAFLLEKTEDERRQELRSEQTLDSRSEPFVSVSEKQKPVLEPGNETQPELNEPEPAIERSRERSLEPDSVRDAGKEQVAPDKPGLEQSMEKGKVPENPRQCSEDSHCKVFSDCCQCTPRLAWENPAVCKKNCKVDTCTAWGVKSPVSYCFKSRCQLGAKTAKNCQSDRDCQLYSDCCYCMALPKGLRVPKCNIKTCFANTCTVRGVGSYRARCVSGMCRIAP